MNRDRRAVMGERLDERFLDPKKQALISYLGRHGIFLEDVREVEHNIYHAEINHVYFSALYRVYTYEEAVDETKDIISWSIDEYGMLRFEGYLGFFAREGDIEEAMWKEFANELLLKQDLGKSKDSADLSTRDKLYIDRKVEREKKRFKEGGLIAWVVGRYGEEGIEVFIHVDKMIDYIVQVEGMGKYLALEDGVEHIEEVNGVKYYIYRES